MQNTQDSTPKAKKQNRNKAAASGDAQKDGNNSGDKAYASSLLLPKTKFPIWIEPNVVQERYQARTTQELYKWQEENLPSPAFVLHDGPPYANGNLHTGHALNKILKDVILRYNILRGRKVNYIPGWDCHGLPVENKALEKLKAEPNTLEPVAVRAAAKQTAEEAIQTQREEMMQFGLVGDWSKEGTYRTMDPAFETRQLKIFQSMVNKGIIYRHFRPVYWSPSSQTALAEAELQYEMHTSTSAYVAFSAIKESLPESVSAITLGKELKLLIWTTTPWTLPANMAISLHPDFEYQVISRKDKDEEVMLVAASRLTALESIIGAYEVVGSLKGSQLEGTQYRPLFTSPSLVDQALPVIMGQEVLDDAGTGLVHMAPSHGHEDYQAFLSRGLLQTYPLINIVDAQGRYTSEVNTLCGQEIGARLVGLEVLFKGNKEILAMLEEAGPGNRLLGVERHRHRYPYDWRTKKPLIIRATAQWFADLGDVKTKALEALETVEFYPPISRNRLEAFVKERSEWCISRQRTWGVPIPALHILQSGEAILDEDSLSYIIKVLDEKGTSYWWDGPIEDFMSPAVAAKYTPDSLMKGTDTMDVWFDSGTSWSLVEGRVADVYLEGSDQHRGWFQSSLLTAVAASDDTLTAKSPFRKLITHGFVLDEKGRKMSKSLGNVISPLTVVNGGSNIKSEPAYGTEVLRLWAVSSQYSGDVTISTIALKQAAELHRKLRMTARFILGSLQDRVNPRVVPRNELSLLDRYVLHELWTLENLAKNAYDKFAFHEVVAALSHFMNTTLSSLYFDVSKDILYADPVTSETRHGILYVLHSILQTITPVVAPLTPYLTEEVNDIIHEQASSPSASFFASGWKPALDEWNDMDAKRDMERLLGIRKAIVDLVDKARTEKKLRSSLEADVEISIPNQLQDVELSTLLQSQKTFLNQLFIISEVDLRIGQPSTFDGAWEFSELVHTPNEGQDIHISLRPARRHKCPRCWAFTRETEAKVCNRCEGALGGQLQ